MEHMEEAEKLDIVDYQKKKCTWELGKKEGDPHIHTKV
jgi:hypothetical protein